MHRSRVAPYRTVSPALGVSSCSLATRTRAFGVYGHSCSRTAWGTRGDRRQISSQGLCYRPIPQLRLETPSRSVEGSGQLTADSVGAIGKTRYCGITPHRLR